MTRIDSRDLPDPVPVQPVPQQQPVQPPAFVGHYGYLPSRPPVNVLSIISLVAGVLWLFWAGSIVAVVTGHLALRQISQHRERGYPMAVLGLCLGYIGLLTLGVGILGSIFD